MADTVKRACKCCQRESSQEKIPSISSGQVYWACKDCGTVTHEPAKPETTS